MPNQQEVEQRAEAAQRVADTVLELVGGDLTWVPQLRRAVRSLARQCGGVLPGGLRAAWKTLETELTIAGDLGAVESPVVNAANELAATVAAEYRLTLHMEAVHDPDRDYRAGGSGISASQYFAGAVDDSPDELGSVEVAEDAGPGDPETAGDPEGD